MCFWSFVRPEWKGKRDNKRNVKRIGSGKKSGMVKKMKNVETVIIVCRENLTV